MGEWSTVYGPVPSWRLGFSLGIDPLKPPKTCTFDCIYCQLGKTVKKVSKPEDVYPHVSTRKILKDLEKTLKKVDLKNVDYLTFSGTGEPTLNPNLGEVVDEVKRLINDKPIAILTNSSLLDRETVRRSLKKMDLVVAKLDAPNQKLFKKINRPSNGITLTSIIKGLKSLRKEYSGRLAIQIMFVKSTMGEKLNTEKEVVEGLTRIIEKVSPDEVYINIPTRPPSENHVTIPENQEIEKISKMFGERLNWIKVVSRMATSKTWKKMEKKVLEDLEKRIMETLKRRPCNLKDLTEIFGVPEKTLSLHLNSLVEKGKILALKYQGLTYYKLANL